VTHEKMAEIMLTLRMGCIHGYPVRVYARLGVNGESCAFDGWVWGSTSCSSVMLCLGEQRYVFEWSEIEDATFYTPLAERLTGAWLREHL
jgi:hypothetical protein